MTIEASPAISLADNRVRRQRGVLADGREILYYDDTEPYLSGDASRVTLDHRRLPPAGGGSTLRLDMLTGEWVAIASHRNTRTFLPPADACPLCPTRDGGFPSEIPSDTYDVVVFENQFPSLSTRPVETPTLVDGEPLWPVRPGLGRCDVVCFTSDHNSSFASLSQSRVRTVIEAWADRTATLSEMPDVHQVFVFENRGQEIGVTLHHPHGQIYGYPFLPPRSAQLQHQARKYTRATGGHLLADLLAAEKRVGTRVVATGEYWTAYVPAAARWPVEVHLAPHRDLPDLAALDEGEREELSLLYPELLRRLDRFFEGVDAAPYIAGWHQAPVDEERELGRLHLQLFSMLRAPGKLKYLAGSESGVGAWINDITPESIAQRLRDVAS